MRLRSTATHKRNENRELLPGIEQLRSYFHSQVSYGVHYEQLLCVVYILLGLCCLLLHHCRPASTTSFETSFIASCVVSSEVLQVLLLIEAGS